MPRNRKAHDVIHLTNGRKLLILTNEPHSREYKRLMKLEDKRWKEYISDCLIAWGSDDPDKAIKEVKKKWGIKL